MEPWFRFCVSAFCLFEPTDYSLQPSAALWDTSVNISVLDFWVADEDFAGLDVDFILGMDVFDNRIITIDPREKRLYVQ